MTADPAADVPAPLRGPASALASWMPSRPRPRRKWRPKMAEVSLSPLHGHAAAYGRRGKLPKGHAGAGFL